jgi:hypothetical protein
VNNDARQLVQAAHDALVLRRFRTIAPDLDKMAAVATVAVLQQLAELMSEAEDNGVSNWPDADDVRLIASHVERSL